MCLVVLCCFVCLYGLFLSICGDLRTVKTSFLVGNGIGPLTWAPVLLAVFTISIVDKSKILSTPNIQEQIDIRSSNSDFRSSGFRSSEFRS